MMGDDDDDYDGDDDRYDDDDMQDDDDRYDDRYDDDDDDDDSFLFQLAIPLKSMTVVRTSSDTGFEISSPFLAGKIR